MWLSWLWSLSPHLDLLINFLICNKTAYTSCAHWHFFIDLLELLYLRGGHLGDLQSQQVVCVVPGQDELVVPWHIHLKREKYIIQSCLQKTAQFKMAQHYWGARVQRFGWVKVQSVLRSSIWYLQVEYKSTRIVWINFLFNGISM